MDLATVILSTVSGVVASGFTAYFTSRSKIAEERRKWEQDFKMKYAEALGQNRESAANFARQFGIGYLVERGNDKQGTRTFIAPNSRIIIGASPTCDIVVTDPMHGVSNMSLSVESDSKDVYVTDLNTSNGSKLNGALLRAGQKVHLGSGDIIMLGPDIAFSYHSL